MIGEEQTMAEEIVNKENPAETDTNAVGALKERITELEKVLADRDTELTAVKKSVVELQEKLSAQGAELIKAAAEYRTLVLQTNPGITEELITGESISAINESLAKARSLIGKVRQSVEKDIARTRVPIGAPGRQTPDISALSPREKIHYAIGGKK
jgi:chromosome segregation ATPase